MVGNRGTIMNGNYYERYTSYIITPQQQNSFEKKNVSLSMHMQERVNLCEIWYSTVSGHYRHCGTHIYQIESLEICGT